MTKGDLKLFAVVVVVSYAAMKYGEIHLDGTTGAVLMVVLVFGPVLWVIQALRSRR